MGDRATHVILIRGINVGGKNIVPMASLRAALSDAGYGRVRTYIQSGNVVVDAPVGADVSSDAQRILADEFSVVTPVMVVESPHLASVVADAPAGFGSDTDEFKHDVVFLSSHVDPAALLDKIRLRDGVDEAWSGQEVLYFRRQSALVARSYMNKIVSMPEYADMTIRNWRTTCAVADLAAT